MIEPRDNPFTLLDSAHHLNGRRDSERAWDWQGCVPLWPVAKVEAAAGGSGVRLRCMTENDADTHPLVRHRANSGRRGLLARGRVMRFTALPDVRGTVSD